MEFGLGSRGFKVEDTKCMAHNIQYSPFTFGWKFAVDNKCRMLGRILFNIAYCLHELGENEKSRELLVNSYYINKAMERTKSCGVVKQYAKENLGMEID